MAKTRAKTADKPAAMPAEPLERSPGHMLHRALQTALDIYSAEMGPDGLTQRQFAVLTAAEARVAPTQTDLVQATGIDRSTLADMVARLARRGLLERERSAADGRAKAVSLTEAGRAALAEAGPRVEAADRRILALLPKRHRDGFTALLSALSKPEPAKAAKARPDKAERKAMKAARKAAKANKPEKAKKSRKAPPEPVAA